MPRQERVYFSIDRCLLRSYTEIMNKKEMITEPDYNNGIFRKEQLREPLPAGKY